MEAGRELDALIAAKIFGLQPRPIRIIGRTVTNDVGTTKEYTMRDGREGVSATALPRYSTDIAAAWEVVGDMLSRKNGHVDLSIEPDGVSCVFTSYEQDGEALASTAPLAICITALKAVGYVPID